MVFLHIQQNSSFQDVQIDEYLGSTSKHLFYFVQITDIHITQFGCKDRIKEFEQFCNQIIKSLVKPQVTLVSGDLTHSRDRKFASQQYEEEWIIYRNILNRTHVTQYTTWLDIRGNHDVYMDPDPYSNNSHYRLYSHQGMSHKSSFQYTLTTHDNDTYSFVAIDMCRRPGMGHPFNSLGYLSKDEMKTIENLSEQTQNSNATIFFGHYPLSFTYSKELKQLMRHGIAYLNGHLHSIAKKLYALHSDGLLELELEDWKENRRFRIVTIDSGLLSFEDVRFNQLIYAVICNPKAAKFKTPREPLYRLSQSTHIRILVFSKWPITNVNVSIDSKLLGNAIPSIDNKNLYILSWNTSLYNDHRMHKLTVEIKDNQTNTIQIENEFSLSTTITSARWTRSNFILFIHWPTLGMICIISLLCMYILILMFFRNRSRRMIPCSVFCFTFWNAVRLRIMVLCSIDLFYYALIGLAMYHFIGPWYIGYLTDGYIGVVFLWGIILRGTYLLPDMQIYVATIQLVLFLFPLTLCLCSSCYYRYIQLQSSRSLAESYCNRAIQILTVYILFGYTVLFVLYWSFITTGSYKLAFIISPFGLTLTLFSLFLYIKSKRLKLEDFHFQSIANDYST